MFSSVIFSLSRATAITGYDLAAILIAIFILVSVIVSLFVNLEKKSTEEDQHQLMTKPRSHTVHSSNASTKDINYERKRMQEKLSKIATHSL